MKNKIIIGLATLLGALVFFNSPNVRADGQSDAEAEVAKITQGVDSTNDALNQAGVNDGKTSGIKIDADSKDNKGTVGDVDRVVGRDPDEISADVIKQHLNANDMDWVNQNILQNYQMYYQSAGVTDLSGNVAHMLSDLFQNINTNIVYSVTDAGLSRLFDLTTITSSMNTVIAQIGIFNQNIWGLDVFRWLLALAFAVGLVWAFVVFAKDLKRLWFVFLIAIMGAAWVGAGSTVLTNLNNYTSVTQTAVFQATSNTDQAKVADTSNSFKNAIRHEYFTKTIERPFYLGNFGVPSADKVDSSDGDPYKLLGSKASGKVKKDFSNQKYMKAGSSYSWLQTTIAFMSPAVSVAYAVPYLGIGVANMVLQLGAIAVYFIAPFIALLSLIPKYSGLLMKTIAMGVGMLLGKIALLFGIVFVNWTGDIVDIVVPPVNNGSAMLNSLLFIVLMIILWKKKGAIVNLIAGGASIGNMADKLSLSRPAKRGGGIAKNALASYIGNRFANKKKVGEPDEEDPEELEELQEEERRNERLDSFLDEQDLQRQREQEKAERASRLSHQNIHDVARNLGVLDHEQEREERLTDLNQDGGRHLDTNESGKPKVKRRAELIEDEPNSSENGPTNPSRKRDINLDRDLKTSDHKEKPGVGD